MLNRIIPAKLFYVFFLAGMIVFSFSLTAAELEIEGSSYSFNESKGIAEYVNPRMVFGGFTVTAESLLYYQKENRVVMSGGIYAQDRGILITADKLIFDITTRQTEIFQSTLFHEAKNLYIRADKIERISEDEYRVYDAHLTQCRPEQKAWEITSDKIVYYPNDFAWATHVAFFMHSVPLAYTPVTAWSTKQNRSTGFLPPSYLDKQSDDPSVSFGHRLQIPYFIALDQEQDVTLKADLMSNRGVGLDLEYNYAFEKGMLGIMRYWGLDETLAQRSPNDEYGMVEDDNPNPNRYTFHWDHKQNLLGGQLYIKTLLNSDNEVRKEYEALNVDTDAHRINELDYFYAWNSGSISIAAEQNDNFSYASRYLVDTDEKTHLNRQPALSFSQAWESVIGFPVQGSLSSEWTQFNRENGWKGKRGVIDLALSTNTNISFLNIVPSVKRRWRDYDVAYSFAENEVSTSQFVDQPETFGWKQDYADLELNFELFKLFYPSEDAFSPSSKLSLIPRFKWSYIEDVDQRKALSTTPSNPILSNTLSDYSNFSVLFDGLDQEISKRSFTFQLDTLYYTKEQVSGEITKHFELNIIQPWNLNRKSSAAETEEEFEGPQIAESWQETEYGETRLPLRLNLGFWPSQQFAIKLFYRIENPSADMLENKIELSTNYIDGSQLNISYHNNRQAYTNLNGDYLSEARYYQLNETLVLDDRWKLELAGRWDFTRKSLPLDGTDIDRIDRQLSNASATLFFNHGCYKLLASYQESIKTKTLTTGYREYVDRQISFTFEINEALKTSYSAGIANGAN